MIELGVNVDHVATVRQARRTYEPDPIWAAVEAHLGGADGITVHLREDRRHIQDKDVSRLRELTHIKLNLEMAATDEMVAIARRIKPGMAMLVPEGRHEITTEGGLNVFSSEKKLAKAVARLAAGAPQAAILRGFERRMLAELGYAPVLDRDAANGAAIEPDKRYAYEAERGPVETRRSDGDSVISGRTLLDMAADDYDDARTREEARRLMRALIADRLGGQSLHTRAVLSELQDL